MFFILFLGKDSGLTSDDLDLTELMQTQSFLCTIN